MSDNEQDRMPIVSAAWLQARLLDDDLRVVDASWYMPAAGRDAQGEFHQGHIPGAVFFDIDEHSTPGQLPHTLPDAEQFSMAAQSLGIADQQVIVVYDTSGLFSAARVWWMFRHFGARQVYVLDGGLPAWLACGGELVSSEPGSLNAVASGKSSLRRFQVNTSARERQRQVADVAQVSDAVNNTACIILDARSAGRFSGEEQEPRAGLRSGHIPGSLNLPYNEVLDDQGKLKSATELKQLFDKLPLTSGRQIITTCGSGVTAAVLCLALACAGYDEVALYDGSWSEWGALPDVPVASGV